MSPQTIIKTETLPTMALRGLVMFPNMSLTFDVGRKKSVNAVKAAMESNQLIFLVAQKDISVEETKEKDLYEIGCVAKIRQILKVSDSNFKVLVDGLYRARRITCSEHSGYLVCGVEKCEDQLTKHRAIYIETLVRKIRAQFEEYLEVSPPLAPDIVMTVSTNEDIGYLSDYIAFNIPAPFDDKQYILEQLSPVKRAKILLEMLDKERQILEIDNKISQKTKRAIDDNQRDYYLKEQMRIISNELYGDDSAEEVDRYYESVQHLNADTKVKEALFSEINRLSKMPQGSHEGTVLRDYLDMCISLPWNCCTSSKVDIKKAEKILNRDFYGMDKVKKRIIEMLSVFAISPDILFPVAAVSVLITRFPIPQRINPFCSRNVRSLSVQPRSLPMAAIISLLSLVCNALFKLVEGFTLSRAKQRGCDCVFDSERNFTHSARVL